jgi:alkane 1-monooxygenase
MGESIYRFVLREVPATFVRAWELERRRLSRKGLSVFSFRNEIVQGWLITGTAIAIAAVLFGWAVALFIVVHHMFGYYSLTQANYIEHYGLLRQKRANGHYEPCRPHHSWNTNHRISNLMTFHLQRHSDHHSNPMRPYQALRDLADVPTLPSGYPGMFVLAAIPPLWFRVMDPRVMAWADGDLAKVNVLEERRQKLERRWQVLPG